MLQREDFIHPSDEAALRKLEALPGFPTLVKKILEIGVEQYYYGINTASYIKLSDAQLPQIYNRLVTVAGKIGMDMPEFFLEMNPSPNAYTLGDSKIFVSVTSGLLEYLTEEEVDAVLAHECGHIICRHVLYHMVASYITSGLEMVGLIGNLAIPLKYALLHWDRMSELSCDRVAALVTSPKTVMGMLARLAGGPYSITKDLDFRAWADQADEYERICSSGNINNIMQMWATMQLDHPFTAVRVRELLMWCASKDYWIAKEKMGLLKSSGVTVGDMNFCSNCKKMIDRQWSYCNFCGYKLK